MSLMPFASPWKICKEASLWISNSRYSNARQTQWRTPWTCLPDNRRMTLPLFVRIILESVWKIGCGKRCNRLMPDAYSLLFLIIRHANATEFSDWPPKHQRLLAALAQCTGMQNGFFVHIFAENFLFDPPIICLLYFYGLVNSLNTCIDSPITTKIKNNIITSFYWWNIHPLSLSCFTKYGKYRELRVIYKTLNIL